MLSFHPYKFLWTHTGLAGPNSSYCFFGFVLFCFRRIHYWLWYPIQSKNFYLKLDWLCSKKDLFLTAGLRGNALEAFVCRVNSVWLFWIYTCLNFVFPKIQFPSILTKVFLISGGFWNLMKRHLICVFSILVFFNKISVFSEKKNCNGICVCVPKQMDAVRYGNSFPKDLVSSCFVHMPLSCGHKRRATDL